MSRTIPSSHGLLILQPNEPSSPFTSDADWRRRKKRVQKSEGVLGAPAPALLRLCLSASYYFGNYLADVAILEVIYLLGGGASMKHLRVYANLPSSRPRSIRWPGVAAISQPASQSDSEVGTTAGGGPGSGLGSSSGTGADRAFRVVKSETMKRADHKR